MSYRSTATPGATSNREVPVIRLQADSELWKIYEFGKTLGQGSFGIVYEATHIATQTKWAIKEVRKPAAGSSKFKMLDNEINILKQVDHAHIIHLEVTYNTPTKICLVTELCRGGTLKQQLHQKKFFTEDETRKIIYCLADAVVYLHKRDIVHRDLKLENILVKNSPDDNEDWFDIKVADFGLSVKADGVGIRKVLTDSCGTLLYMAPEMMSGRGYSHWCDVWSIGVIMFMLLCGEPPFHSKSKERLVRKIMRKQVKFTQPIWATVSDGGKYVLTCLLKTDPAYRLSAHQLLDHPWITGDTTVPLGPSNVLEMMKHYVGNEDGNNEEESETENDSVSTSSEDDEVPGLDIICLPSKKSSPCESTKAAKAKVQPSKGSKVKISPERSTSRPSTSTKLSLSIKSSTLLSSISEKSEDKTDATSLSTKSEKGHSSSRKTTPLPHGKAKKQHRKKRSKKSKSSSSEQKIKTKEKKEIKGKK
ncbi:PREDICTED: serine/threonine-protein kinase 33 isoform X1 [Poecilia mexicana]|uniref:serine/threonine-protein kinase 33 isoform X1 n=1 Tax=Poecilia mexicana TaxID=48701 RepID=UPI00072E6516|nr:PREDICTED: serine/threonine-protein kinase 33 isoform X1 [Poecilia mexicana]XP_014855486.1 PREDICTED: serine/threonine-protein kinase 33 isoform X1 [Poecilia mexicana]